MKTLGLIGGTTWLSTADYYRLINQKVNARLGNLHSAKLVMSSVNMEEAIRFGNRNDWEGLGNYFSAEARKLETAGAEAIVICANTPHIAAGAIRKNIGVPLIHIAEVTARAVAGHKLGKVVLLGTRFTMEQPVFKDIFSAQGIEVLVPEKDDREFIHASIFGELGKEIFRKETKDRYLRIISGLQSQGAEGVILGCTEIPLLIRQDDISLKSFDTTLIHVEAAVDFIFS